MHDEHDNAAPLPPAGGGQVQRPVRPLATPPAHWDEWAMRKANAVYDNAVKLHMGSDSRCRAAIHVALVDAMRFAVAAADR